MRDTIKYFIQLLCTSLCKVKPMRSNYKMLIMSCSGRIYICVYLVIYFCSKTNVSCKENNRGSKFFIDLFFPLHEPVYNKQNVYQTNPITRCECGLANNLIGRPQLRIINGTEIGFHRYPWLAMLLYKNEFICGATLISDLYVLTAGHCLKPEFGKNDLKILLGEHDHCTSNSDTVTFSISDIVRHSLFNMVTFENDIMLLRLTMKVSFNKFIQPICLPDYAYYNRYVTSIFLGKTGTIVGWGDTNPNSDLSASCVPLEASLPVLGKNSCPDTAPTLFCAGYLNGQADSCKGDSGGPLQIINNVQRYEIIGITSSGEGCAQIGKPGLYTDVLQFIPWINQQISDSTPCWNYPFNNSPFSYIAYK